MLKITIRNFLSGRTQQVIFDGCVSDSLPVFPGVPQGTVLGPLLFLCFINDVPECVSSKIQLYADKVLLYREIETREDCIKLQMDLDALQNWENTWKMHFNPAKCYYTRFTNKQCHIVHSYYIHNAELAENSTMKYLGISIDNKLTWRNHVDSIVGKANNIIGFLAGWRDNCHSHLNLCRKRITSCLTIILVAG